MNRRAFIDEFRAMAGDKAKPYLWSDDELTKWLNDGEAEAAIRARLIRGSDEISVSAGEATYDLPAGAFDIQFAELQPADGSDAVAIKASSRRDLDTYRRGWRTEVVRPEFFILDDQTLTLSSAVDADYVLAIEFFRTPADKMAADSDCPAIAEQHHEPLLHWVFHKAYGKQDADGFDPVKSADAEARFTSYFGRRPSADLRRRQNANRPHRNRVHL